MTRLLITAVIILCIIINPTVSGVGDGPIEVEEWIKNHRFAQQKTTKFHFYFHDLLQGNNITAAIVAQANMTATSPTVFGLLTIMDDPLTTGPELSSRSLGYAQGFYVTASFEEVSFLCGISFVFTGGKNNGSTLSVLGHNSPQHMYREMPIVGGTGRFRLARGIVTFKNYYLNFTAGNATIEVHGVVLHY